MYLTGCWAVCVDQNEVTSTKLQDEVDVSIKIKRCQNRANSYSIVHAGRVHLLPVWYFNYCTTDVDTADVCITGINIKEEVLCWCQSTSIKEFPACKNWKRKRPGRVWGRSFTLPFISYSCFEVIFLDNFPSHSRSRTPNHWLWCDDDHHPWDFTSDLKKQFFYNYFPVSIWRGILVNINSRKWGIILIPLLISIQFFKISWIEH